MDGASATGSGLIPLAEMTQTAVDPITADSTASAQTAKYPPDQIAKIQPASCQAMEVKKSHHANYDAVLERLEGLEEFKALNEVDKRIMSHHIKFPKMHKNRIAARLGIKPHRVYAFFYSDSYSNVNASLGRYEILNLAVPALKALEECLHSKMPSIKLAAAVKVLNEVGILKMDPKQIKQDNKMLVVWGGQKKAVNAVAEEAAAEEAKEALELGENNGAINTVQAPPEARRSA